MADIQIEGDCAQITEKQLEYIKSVIEKSGFENNKVIIEPIGEAGDNYMANVKRIIIENENGSIIKMVAKVAPQNEMQRKFGNTNLVFSNEHVMYTQVFPTFTQLEEKYDVPQQDRLVYPKCHGSCSEAPNEVILLEDLSAFDFKMISRFEPLSNDCVKSIIRNFALLHSLSYVVKYKEPETFDEFKCGLFDMMANMDDSLFAADHFDSMESKIINMLESEYHKKAIKEAITGSIDKVVKISNSDRDSKYSVIQHGDAWTNNFLFKYNSDTVQSILIDYQLAKVANPVCDLLFMISSSTDYETRKEHYYEWIDYYYSELDKSLSNYGLKSNFVYPRDQLDADIKRYAKIVLGQTIFMSGIIVLKPEEAIVMKEAMQDMEAMATQGGAANSKDPETIAMFKKKIEGVIDSYRDFGLF